MRTRLALRAGEDWGAMEISLGRRQHLPLNPNKVSRLTPYFYISKIYPRTKRCGGKLGRTDICPRTTGTRSLGQSQKPGARGAMPHIANRIRWNMTHSPEKVLQICMMLEFTTQNSVKRAKYKA